MKGVFEIMRTIFQKEYSKCSEDATFPALPLKRDPVLVVVEGNPLTVS